MDDGHNAAASGFGDETVKSFAHARLEVGHRFGAGNDVPALLGEEPCGDGIALGDTLGERRLPLAETYFLVAPRTQRSWSPSPRRAEPLSRLLGAAVTRPTPERTCRRARGRLRAPGRDRCRSAAGRRHRPQGRRP